MAKKQSESLWQKANKHKVNEYNKTYRKRKVQATVVIEPWVKEQIDKVKSPSQTYGNWLRLLAEDWAKQAKPEQAHNL